MASTYTRQADKQFFLLCLIVLSCFVVSSILEYAIDLGWVVGVLEFLAGILPLYFLWSRGSFRYSRLGKSLFMGMAISTVGALMLLQHWAYARFVLLAGVGVMVVGYALWYTQKSLKLFSDHLKMVFILAHVIAFGFRINHYNGTFVLQLIAFIFLWFAFFSFYFERRKMRAPTDTPKYDFSRLSKN